MLVVVTEDFELYHDLLDILEKRNVTFTTKTPGAELPPETELVITGPDEDLSLPDRVTVINAVHDDLRETVETAITALRGADGRTVVGIDPGDRPGVAVLVGDVVVATFQVPPADVPTVVNREIEDASDPLVRIGDGARLVGARIIEAVDAPIELVDETGTTPYLGTGARGVGDIIAAINIAKIPGEPIESREIEPTEGEIQRIQDQSRMRSRTNRAIDATLARRVARGELTLEEALDLHRS